MSKLDKNAFDLVREVGFLSELSDEDFKKTVDLATVQHRDAGAMIFQEGASCEDLFLVISGSVALDMHVPRRGQIRILTVGAGEVLAWSALWGDQRMTATGTALVDTTLVSIPGRKLQQLCEADQDIGYAVMRRMAVALSRRLLAARIQLLDLFSETQPT